MRLRFPLIAIFLLSLLNLPAMAGPSPDLDTMIGQMLMAGFRGYDVNEKSPIVRDIKDLSLGGVILFDYDVALKKPERNIQTPAQVRQLTSDLQSYAEIPLLIAVDQEGGRVQRLKPKYGFKGTVSAQELGAGDNAIIQDAAATIGRTLKKAGFNLDFAPSADVNVNPDMDAVINVSHVIILVCTLFHEVTRLIFIKYIYNFFKRITATIESCHDCGFASTSRDTAAQGQTATRG